MGWRCTGRLRMGSRSLHCDEQWQQSRCGSIEGCGVALPPKGSDASFSSVGRCDRECGAAHWRKRSFLRTAPFHLFDAQQRCGGQPRARTGGARPGCTREEESIRAPMIHPRSFSSAAQRSQAFDAHCHETTFLACKLPGFDRKTVLNCVRWQQRGVWQVTGQRAAGHRAALAAAIGDATAREVDLS